MKRALIVFIVISVLTACSPTPGPEAASEIVSETKPPAISTPVEEATQAPVREEPTATHPAPIVFEELPIQVISPLDEAVLDSPKVDVTGIAPAGTVLSVNDEIILVGESGEFRSLAKLP